MASFNGYLRTKKESMFKGLQQKWKVSGWQLFLILCVFAITGTTTAWISKAITGWVGLTPDDPLLWRILLRLAVLIFGYMVIILVVSLPFGQFSFFWKYEKKILRRFGLIGRPDTTTPGIPGIVTGLSATQADQIIRIGIFASGTGSNAARIIDHFRNSTRVQVALVVCNKPGAGVLQVAEQAQIPTLLLEKDRFFAGDAYIPELRAKGITFLVLAGFLWKIPSALLTAYPHRIVNIHPALLPAFGGKGMYGRRVHEAVLASGQKESGITIHYVDDIYDHGQTIFQATCPVCGDDTPESLANRVHHLEHEHYPRVIEQLLLEPAPPGSGNKLP